MASKSGKSPVGKSGGRKSPVDNGAATKAGAKRRAAKPAIIDLVASEVKEEAVEAAAATKVTEATTSTQISAETEATGKSQGASAASAKNETVHAATPKGGDKVASARPDDSVKAPQSTPKMSAKSDDRDGSGPPPNAAVAASNGGGRGWLAGIIGGIIGAGLLYGGLYSGLVPVPNAGQPTDAAPIADLRTSLEGLQTRLQGLESAPANAVAPADVAELDARLAAVETALPAANDNQDQLAGVEQQIKTLQESVATMNASDTGVIDLAPINERMAAVETSVQELKADLETQGGVDPAAMSKITGAVSTLSDDIAKTAGDLQSLSARVDRDITRLDGDVSALAKAAEEQAANAASIDGAKIQAALSLRDAVRLGTVPARLLGDAETLGLDVAPLRDAAVGGIATMAMLRNSFAGHVGAMLAAANPAAPGILGRIGDSARSLISIRPVGPQAGDTPAARISRIEEALGNDDVGRAKMEFDTLPAAVQAAGGEFATMLRKRQAAQAAAERLVATSIGGLGADGQFGADGQ